MSGGQILMSTNNPFTSQSRTTFEQLFAATYVHDSDMDDKTAGRHTRLVVIIEEGMYGPLGKWTPRNTLDV